jgi:hypothetical protein
MNSRAEVDDLRTKLAEAEKAKQALETNLKTSQTALAERVFVVNIDTVLRLIIS